MNNHWGTNYRAYQEGLAVFRFILRPFRNTTPDEATRFATGFSQPLIAVAASGGKVKSTPVLSVEPSGVIVTGFKPSDDGKAVIVRLFGASGKDCKVKLNWAEPSPGNVYLSNTSEKPLEQAGKYIKVPAWGIVTLRAERPAATTFALSALPATGFHVAITGNDANPGTRAAPLRTIQRAADKLDLAGEWRVKLDPSSVGEEEKWMGGPLADAVTAKLPGSLTTNHLGDDITLNTPWMGSTGNGGFTTDPRYAPYRQPGQIKIPFWLQPVKYYKGKAWYQREVTVPAGWQGKQVALLLERCHWASTSWIDGRKIGSCESLSVPHRYNLGALTAGKHLLTVCVDNNYLIRVGPDASSVTDHTQTNWNGIIGKIEMSAHSAVTIVDQQIYPKNDGTVQVRINLHNSGKETVEATLNLVFSENPSGAQVGTTAKSVAVPSTGATIVIDLKLAPPPKLWSESAPNLYTATATVGDESVSDTFGFREIRADGRTILVNGVPVFMRGNLDCASFPLTGHPSMDVAEWTRIFRVYKAYGLNHARFHSWCPPKAAFIAADQEGIYLQAEGAVWRGTCPFPNAKPVEPFLYEEAERICREYGNHPSFVIYTHGNEPWELDQKALNYEWVPAMKKLDLRHLVAAGSNYPLGDNNDVHIPGGGYGVRYHEAFNTPPATTRNYEEFVATKAAPCITHEPGEWCVFPNLREIDKYIGVMKARNLEIVRDFMTQSHMLDQADEFLMASGKFQTLVYKEETEAFLRTRGLAGFQMLGLNDFPGQGTALIGVVDVFWDAKPYVTAAEYKRFSGPVVPLALMEKRTWTSGETFTAKIRIAQYSGAPLADARPVWKITDSRGKQIASGNLTAGTIPVGNSTELGEVFLPLNTQTSADKLTLTVTIPGTGYGNDWSFWVYPEKEALEPGKVLVHSTLAAALPDLAKGSTVLLAVKPNQVVGSTVGTFQPIFWNKAWFPGQKEHTLGMLIQNTHPALGGFSTDSHADWQWWDLMQNSKPMTLDSLPPELRPIVQPIDDWNTCRRLGNLIEAKVGPGKLMLCSMDLQTGIDQRPVARRLLACLLRHMNSDAFKPTVDLTAEQLATLLKNNTGTEMEISATSSHGNHPVENLFDGDPTTIWHSDWENRSLGYPYAVTLKFAQPAIVRAVNFQPRQDNLSNGRVKSVKIETSSDGKAWQTTVPAATLKNTTEWQSVTLGTAAKCGYLRITLLAPQNPSESFASFAEISITSE
jgi:hypothetical protein